MINKLSRRLYFNAVCPDPLNIPDGSFAITQPTGGATAYVPNTVVEYTCNNLNTHKLTGVATLTCQADGTWDNPQPLCDLIGKRVLSL